MGQEASVPRNNAGADGGEGTTTPTNHQAPPQGGRVSSPNAAAAADGINNLNNAATRIISPASSPTGSVGLGVAGQQAGIMPYQQQPQSSSQYQSNAAATASSPQHAVSSPPSQQTPPTTTTSASLMSRAGISSMIQRMGGSGRTIQSAISGGSSHGLTSSGRKSGRGSGAAQTIANQQQLSPMNNGAHSAPHSPARNAHANSIHHQDLSPESKARQMSMMMKKQQQLEQQRQQQQHPPPPPPAIQQSSLSSYHSATSNVDSQHESNTFVNMMYAHEGGETTSSERTDPISNLSGGKQNDAGLVQGISNMKISNNQNQQQTPQRPMHQQQTQQAKQAKSPPSPRSIALKKMQNNDEEDWEKAWAEDSESDDDGEEDGDATISGSTISTAVATAGSDRALAIPTLTSGAVAAGAASGGSGQQQQLPPYRPDVDSAHSSASVQVIPPRSNAAMHSAFTPAKPQPQQQLGGMQQQQMQGQYPQHSEQQQQQYQQQNAQYPTPIKTPIIQYPPIQSSSHFKSPDFPTTQPEIDEDARLVREANAALQQQHDGSGNEAGVGGSDNHWEYRQGAEYGVSMDGVGEEEEEERPCVAMFDPALRVLGRGSFGRVVLVQKQHGQGTGALYAMKILRKSHLVRRRQIERTKTERKVLSMLDHPFIMKMYYAFQTPEKLYLVLDYCPGGELFFHLSRYRRFQEPVARFYAAELLLAIGHLHKNGIIYRDLKPENVLLDAYGHVKLGDFGLAKDGIRHPTQGAKSTCGTPEYMAPEVLNQGGHGFCVDYWGLGMILYEMMTGLPPWYTTDRSKLFRRLRSAPLVFPKEVHFSPHCKACIAGLLDREPRMRLGVMGLRSAMRHEFFYRRINFEALRARHIAAPIRPCEGWRQFQSRSNSAISMSDSEHNANLQYSSHAGGSEQGGWHSAGPSLDSAAMGNISAEALDVATANFDDSFRRMPIETEDYEKQQQAAGHPPISEKDLNASTFRGFTFDGDLPMIDGNEQSHYPHPPASGGSHRGSNGGVV